MAAVGCRRAQIFFGSWLDVVAAGAPATSAEGTRIVMVATSFPRMMREAVSFTAANRFRLVKCAKPDTRKYDPLTCSGSTNHCSLATKEVTREVRILVLKMDSELVADNLRIARLGFLDDI